MKKASLVVAGDVINYPHLGKCKVLGVQANWMEQGGWVYFKLEGRKGRFSLWHDIEV